MVVPLGDRPGTAFSTPKAQRIASNRTLPKGALHVMSLFGEPHWVSPRRRTPEGWMPK